MYTLAILSLLAAVEPPATVDYLIRGATIYDGTAWAGRTGDIAIRDDSVVAVGELSGWSSQRIVEARGMIVAPGFIDLHTHSDGEITQPHTRANLNYLMQGVTTVVTGNCGAGPTEVRRMMDSIATNGAGSNVVHLIPHGAVRRAVVGEANRIATPAELTAMVQLVEREMTDGAWGMSTGLIYTPGCFAPVDELITLSRVVASRGGIYASHIRGEGSDRLLDAIAEAIQIGRDAGLPAHISHLKASGKPAWGKIRDACALIEAARERGQPVTADQYPYVASSTSLAAMTVPADAREGGTADLMRRLDDAVTGPKLRQRIASDLDERGGGASIRIASYAANRQWVGKSLADIAQTESREVIDIVIEMLRHGGAGAVSFGMSEDDVRFAMQRPYVATASDGSARVPDETRPHPRSYGCFARKIGRYAIEERVLALELAIRSASGLPADILGLKDRGYLKPGFRADVIVFDPNEFRDMATFDDPHQYARGMKHVFVNGLLSVDAGQFTGVLGGRPLRHGK